MMRPWVAMLWSSVFVSACGGGEAREGTAASSGPKSASPPASAAPVASAAPQGASAAPVDSAAPAVPGGETTVAQIVKATETDAMPFVEKPIVVIGRYEASNQTSWDNGKIWTINLNDPTDRDVYVDCATDKEVKDIPVGAKIRAEGTFLYSGRPIIKPCKYTVLP